MNQIEALAKLQVLGQRLFQSQDIAAQLKVTGANAAKIASRLTQQGHLIKLARGKWALPPIPNNLSIAEHLTFPYPAYISLQTALYLHGMVSQIPGVTYAISLARTRRYATPLGTFSIHHTEADFFFGFELEKSGSAKIAVVEKALVDLCYFSPTRSRLFVRLPELEIAPTFSWRKAYQMAARIRSRARRRLVMEKLKALQGKDT